MDEKNLNFLGFRRALSAKMSELTAQGIGTVKKTTSGTGVGKTRKEPLGEECFGKFHLKIITIFGFFLQL